MSRPMILDCQTLWDLEVGGAPHDLSSQDPHDAVYSCPCVRPHQVQGFRALGMTHYPAGLDDPRPCNCPEVYVSHGVQVRLCCRCSARLSKGWIAKAIDLLESSPAAGASDSLSTLLQAEGLSSEIQSLPEMVRTAVSTHGQPSIGRLGADDPGAAPFSDLPHPTRGPVVRRGLPPNLSRRGVGSADPFLPVSGRISDERCAAGPVVSDTRQSPDEGRDDTGRPSLASPSRGEA